MKILVTGFNAFGSVKLNPSELIVTRLAMKRAKKSRRRCNIITALLPTEYSKATRLIKQLLRREKPDAVLCLGVAAARQEISLERIALNLDDDALADNAGVVRRDRLIARTGPSLYRSALPLQRMLRALQYHRISARISNHAGTYLCNHIFYVVRHQTAASGILAGFVHLPGPPGRKPRIKAGMSLATMQRAVECCLEILATH